MSIKIKATAKNRMIDHSLRESPQECCGVLGGHGGVICTVYPLRNVALTPETKYEAAPEDLFQASRLMREKGEDLIGVYHSHPRSEAFPSPTDVQLAFYPDAVYFIVSLASDRTIVNAFRICDGVTSAVEYETVTEQSAQML